MGLEGAFAIQAALAQVTELRKNCGDFRSGNGLWDSYGGMGTSWSDVVTTYLFA